MLNVTYKPFMLSVILLSVVAPKIDSHIKCKLTLNNFHNVKGLFTLAKFLVLLEKRTRHNSINWQLSFAQFYRCCAKCQSAKCHSSECLYPQ